MKTARHLSACFVAVLTLGACASSNAASQAARELTAALAAKPDAAAGAAHFETCLACHGANGGGVDNGNVPAIAGQHYRVVVKQLVDFRHSARWDVRMEHFVDKHHLKDAQAIADVARYIADLPRDFIVGRGNGYNLARGEAKYRAVCAGCHGPGGDGNDATRMPRLAGQHQQYIIRQMQDSADGRRPNMKGGHAALVRTLEFDDLDGIGDFLARLSPNPR